MKLSVVIPALEEADWIAGAVESSRTEDAVVIVVDGGSRDGTPDIAALAGARVVASSPGRARQLQVGAELSESDVLVFLHADTRLAPGYGAVIREGLRSPDVVGGAFRLRFDTRSASLRLVEWAARLRAALFGWPYGDQVLFVRRAVLEEIGGVPQAPILEDLDLVRAMRRCGRLALLPLPVTTSARRYLERGVWRTAGTHVLAAAGWTLGVDRARLARWLRR
ncbi:MAG: TIGR04283 family arsenosugar biosynthesis glycosyltransferase [Myxococcota bacterium]